MMIYRCDKCGAEETVNQIVGNEYEYSKRKFGSLRIPLDGCHDVCGKCMKIAEDALCQARKEQGDRLWDRVASLFRSAA